MTGSGKTGYMAPSPILSRLGTVSSTSSEPADASLKAALPATVAVTDSPPLDVADQIGDAPTIHPGLPLPAAVDVRDPSENDAHSDDHESSSPSATTSKSFPVIHQVLVVPGWEPGSQPVAFTNVHSNFVGRDPIPPARTSGSITRSRLRRSASAGHSILSDQ